MTSARAPPIRPRRNTRLRRPPRFRSRSGLSRVLRRWHSTSVRSWEGGSYSYSSPGSFSSSWASLAVLAVRRASPVRYLAPESRCLRMEGTGGTANHGAMPRSRFRHPLNDQLTAISGGTASSGARSLSCRLDAGSSSCTGAEGLGDSAPTDTMARMWRTLGALALAASSMLPMSAPAAPNPSPSLAQIMLPAPSDYTAETSSAISGSFDSHNLSSAWGTRAAEAQTALEQDGFVDGYGITVVNHTIHHRV